VKEIKGQEFGMRHAMARETFLQPRHQQPIGAAQQKAEA